MGSTSFLGFSCPNLLVLFPAYSFSRLVIFRNLYNIFRKCVGTFSGSFLIYFYFYVFNFGLACDHGNPFSALKSKKEKVLDRGQNGFILM